MTGAEGIGGGVAAYFASRAPFASVGAVGGLSGGEGASSLSGGEGGESGAAASASISGIGQLLSALQQLQTQSPSQFPQVVSQISSQLQAAAQQQGEASQGSALSDLASQFQDIASNGDLSQLQYVGGGSTYGSDGQPTGSASNSDLQQLFANLASEVNSTLGN